MGSMGWPASSVWVFIAWLGEHCSANTEATGSGPVEAPKIFFFGLFSQLLKLRFTAMVTYSFHLYSRSSHHFRRGVHYMYILWEIKKCSVCIHLNQKMLLWSIGIWCLVIHYSQCILGKTFAWRLCVGDGHLGSQYTYCTPNSQDLRWRFMFVWNLGLTREEAVFHLGVSTWTVERYPCTHQYLHKKQPPLFVNRGSKQNIQRINLDLGSTA